MISDPDVIGLLYLVAIVCFILALRFLSSPKHARRGNWVGGVGMLVAIGTTLALDGIGNWGLLAIAAAIGAAIGLVGARTVKMTAMPQMVALFNGVGGGAAALVAFSTRSSLASLPAMIDGAERVLGLPPKVASFALPFGVSLLRANTGTSWVVSALFIAKLYGIDLSLGQTLVFALTSVAMSFSVPGIPSGGLFIIAPAFLNAGLPIEGVGILIALDSIPDIFKTCVNVTAHMTSTTLLARAEVLAPVSEPQPIEVLSSEGA